MNDIERKQTYVNQKRILNIIFQKRGFLNSHVNILTSYINIY